MSCTDQSEKAISLKDIPYEILTGNLLPFLQVADVLSLGETCWFFHNVALDPHFWRIRTLTTFRLPPQPIRQKGWLDLYRHLSTARVFTWGYNEGGRLGHHYDQAGRSTELHHRVRTPTEVTALRNEVVVDLGCGGWSTWALTSRGRVYGWGRIQGDEYWNPVIGTPQLIPFTETIVRISTGRKSCLALAESGRLYVVDLEFKYTATVKVSSTDVVQEMPTEEHKVLHMSAGWNFAAAVFKGIGLMVWNPLVPRADVLRFRTQDFQDGHVMLRQYKARQITRTEEDGDPEIIGLMVGDHFLVYLTREGHVYRATISDDAFAASTPITSFRLEQFVTTPKLSYISGSFNHFGLFNTAGDVLFGDEKAQHDTPPRIDPTFQRCGVISLAWGDWHALALFEDGSMFAWGRELRANGCLGMGYRDMEHAREMQLQVDELSVGSRVPRAVTWFSRDRFAFCVAAAGWHSAALVANFTAKK